MVCCTKCTKRENTQLCYQGHQVHRVRRRNCSAARLSLPFLVTSPDTSPPPVFIINCENVIAQFCKWGSGSVCEKDRLHIVTPGLLTGLMGGLTWELMGMGQLVASKQVGRQSEWSVGSIFPFTALYICLAAVKITPIDPPTSSPWPSASAYSCVFMHSSPKFNPELALHLLLLIVMGWVSEWQDGSSLNTDRR